MTTIARWVLALVLGGSAGFAISALLFSRKMQELREAARTSAVARCAADHRVLDLKQHHRESMTIAVDLRKMSEEGHKLRELTLQETRAELELKDSELRELRKAVVHLQDLREGENVAPRGDEVSDETANVT